jgi:hypothetical protein
LILLEQKHTAEHAPGAEGRVELSLEVYAKLGGIAERHGGLIKTVEIKLAGVAADRIPSLVTAGVLVEVRREIYRLSGAPELEHVWILAAWLELDKARGRTSRETRPVAAGETAAVLHGIGDFMPVTHDFIVQSSPTKELSGVRLRVRDLLPGEVTWESWVPVLTVERTIADLVEIRTDESLVADAVRQAMVAGKIVSLDKLARYLAPLAEAHGQRPGDGFGLAADLFATAGITFADD